jgi:Cof subfamily protein (haloacid dehalogenase superfamily)
MSAPLLIATDLDGTVLDARLRISARTRAALSRVERAGIVLVPATARQILGIKMLAPQYPFSGWVASSNGAVVTHLTTDELLAEATIPPASMTGLVERVEAAVPGSAFFVVYGAGRQRAAEASYQRLSQFSDHKLDPAGFPVMSRAQLTGLAANKVAVRHPDLSSAELFALLRSLLVELAVTHSGAPFVEISAGGISKAWGLERLRAHLDIPRERTLAFGDAYNDLEMLSWAGRAIAMSGAPESLLAVADEVAPGVDEDGVAIILEDVLEGALGR